MPIGHTVRVGRDAGGTASESGSTGGKKLNDTIECLLSLRSVRDQFRDAELDRSNEKVAEQLEDLEDRLVDHLAEERALRDGVGLLTVAVVGDFNSGKSTFINALLGTNLCPVGDEPTTASVTHFTYGDKQRFELERDGTRTSIGKREYLSMVRHSKAGDREAYVFHVSTDAPVLAHIRLVDTPGFNAPPPNSNDTRVTENAAGTADALFVITDARKGNPSKTLLEQLDRLRHTRRNESGRPAFLLLNKAELLPPSKRNETKSDSEKQSDGRFRSVTPVSALRLKDTDEAPPLDALEITTRRIRAALSRQKSFEARISATVVNEQGQANYRMDIDGNVYEASVSTDGDLASREQLAEMVRSVASKRHPLLDRQFRRRTSQLRNDWLKVAAGLDSLCNHATMTSSSAGAPGDERMNQALEAIDGAKLQILERIDTIFREVAVDAISKGRPHRPGFWSNKTVYHIDVRLDKVHNEVKNHHNWDQVQMVVTNLTDSLKRVADLEPVPDPDEIAAELKKHGLAIVRDSLYSNRKEFEETEGWKRQRGTWRYVFDDDEALRDRHHDRLALEYKSVASRWALRFSRFLQVTIDKLQETIIRSDEKGQSAVRERDDELTKLRQRIDEMKEQSP